MRLLKRINFQGVQFQNLFRSLIAFLSVGAIDQVWSVGLSGQGRSVVRVPCLTDIQELRLDNTFFLYAGVILSIMVAE